MNSRRDFLSTMICTIFAPFLGKKQPQPPEPPEQNNCSAFIRHACQHGAAMDGMTDDTAAIENVLTTASANNVVMFDGVALVSPTAPLVVAASLASHGGNHGLKFGATGAKAVAMNAPGRVYLDLVVQA